MSGVDLTVDRQNVIRCYLDGETAQSLGRRYDLAPHHVRKYLERWGVPIRSRQEANALRPLRQTPEQRSAQAQAAQAAIRGSTKSPELLARIARTREEQQLFVGGGEVLLMSWLRKLGLDPIPQQAIGRYNIDLGIPPVAVELLVRAALPHNRPKERRKIEYLLDRDTSVLFIWISKKLFLSPAAAEYTVAFHQLAQSSPTPLREYRVIGGTGQLMAVARGNLDDLTIVPPA